VSSLLSLFLLLVPAEVVEHGDGLLGARDVLPSWKVVEVSIAEEEEDWAVSGMLGSWRVVEVLVEVSELCLGLEEVSTCNAY